MKTDYIDPDTGPVLGVAGNGNATASLADTSTLTA